MKKILTIIVISLSLIGCSKKNIDEPSISGNQYHCKIDDNISVVYTVLDEEVITETLKSSNKDVEDIETEGIYSYDAMREYDGFKDVFRVTIEDNKGKFYSIDSNRLIMLDDNMEAIFECKVRG